MTHALYTVLFDGRNEKTGKLKPFIQISEGAGYRGFTCLAYGKRGDAV